MALVFKYIDTTLLGKNFALWIVAVFVHIRQFDFCFLFFEILMGFFSKSFSKFNHSHFFSPMKIFFELWFRTSDMFISSSNKNSFLFTFF